MAVVAVLATTMNYAEAKCVEGTVAGPCTNNGKPGTYHCIGGQPVCVAIDTSGGKKPQPPNPPPKAPQPNPVVVSGSAGVIDPQIAVGGKDVVEAAE